ncbi:LapA family protein [Ornithinibacillus contaminans]|uniref:LapA family protein n=1 Tax=Ornithinibacillus contaminans TaxID=694055 RepID=UPI00064DB9CF|nr:lipopolysaccharide assembly protein LapA domain-containing protein [Ornithinibacillus contaminans]
MKGQSYVILAIIVMILVAIFAVTNVNSVEVTYYFWQAESPLILVILFSVLMGGIITAAAGMVKMFKLQREIKSLKQERDKLNHLMEEHGLQLDDSNKQPNNGTEEAESIENKF